MKVLGIAGSPRRGGNTDLLLEQVMEGARSAGAETESIVLSRLDISPCVHCDGCLATGKCVIDDDMQMIYPKLREVDGLVIASPIFFMGLTAQTKAMIDRCQALWVIKYVLKQPVALSGGRDRKGILVAVGGTEYKSLFQGARLTARSFFSVLDVKPAGELTFPSIDSKGAISQHPTALKDAFEAGRDLVSPSS